MNTELIELPPDWKWTTMGEIADVVGGGTPKTNDPTNYESGTISWITPADLSGYTAKYIAHGARFITKKGLEESSAKMIPAGTVLFTSRAPIGYVAIASRPVCTNQGFKSFVLKEGVLPDYVYWWLKGSKDLAESMASGTTFLELSGAKAKQLPIPVAPLDQQKLIVAEIEKQFSRLDEAVANLKHVKANLKRYKASVLKAAVEGRLVETEAGLARREGRSYETGAQLLQRILETRRSQWQGKGKYKEPAAPDTSDLAELPAGWVWATVDSVCEQIVDCPHSTPRFQSEGIPCVDTTWMTSEGLAIERARYVDDATYQERIARLEPKTGDIVFAREGTIGTAVLVPDRMKPCLGQRVMLLRASTLFLNSLLRHTLHSEIVKSQYRAQSLGSTVAHINVGDVKLFRVPVPPIAEQHRIVTEVDRRLSLIREVDEQVDANVKRAEHLRQSILAKSFSCHD
ncbi:MAG: restriction endonuclease subunit S [Gallionellaceae bacterium]